MLFATLCTCTSTGPDCWANTGAAAKAEMARRDPIRLMMSFLISDFGWGVLDASSSTI